MHAASRQSPRQLLGTTLGPGYRLVALLDSEGRACAYRAWDHTADQYVVVRVGRFSLAPEAFARFEGHSGQLFDSSLPHSVPVIDRGIHDGQPYVVVPYLAGGTLRLRRPHDNARPLLPHPALLHTWLPQIAAALDAILGLGLVHGAVSPDTILFDAASQPWLADFRIAAVERMACPSQAATSPTAGHCPDRVPYLCPQRILGLPASAVSDQYALAAIVYDYLATVPPCGRGSAAEVAAAQAAHQIQPLQRLSPSLPESLCSAVHRALAHNPRDRHATCTAFVSAALADIPQRTPARKLQLICPACRTLVHIEPEAAGRQGRCQACGTTIDVDAELRWLALPDDRLANVPVAGAEQPAPAPRRRWAAAGIATIAAAVTLAMLWLRSEEQPPLPGPEVSQIAPPPKLVAADQDGGEPSQKPDRDDEPEAMEENAANPPSPQPAAAVAATPPPADGVSPADQPEPMAAAAAAPTEPPSDANAIGAANAAVADAPAEQPGNARPAARDIASDAAREEIRALHTKRRQLLATREQLERTLVEQEAVLKSSARSLKANEIQRLQDNRETLVDSFNIEANPVIRQQLLFRLQAVDAELKQLQKQLGDLDADIQKAKLTIKQTQNDLENNAGHGELLRRDWIACLNPLERDESLAVKITELSQEIRESPEFTEARLYRALLYIAAGNLNAARADLALFEGKVDRSAEPLLGSTAVDFVYANLMVGNGPAARRFLKTAERYYPNDPILQHIQALCEIAENNFTTASTRLKTALRGTKKAPPRDRILLCSDAAWLFAAAPNDQVRNAKLAEAHAAEAIRGKSGKAWQAWRAQAVLQADEGLWDDAERSLAEAKKSAPLILADEIDAQMEAIAARQIYRIARREK